MVLGLSYWDEERWWWPVAPGRRAQLTNSGALGEATCFAVEDSELQPLDCTAMGAVDQWYAEPAAWYFDGALYYGPWFWEAYDLDFRTVPTDLPADWFPDADGDGYGDPSGIAVSSDVPIAGTSTDASDCDDTAPAVHPYGLETCDDGIDQDCDGADRFCREKPGLSMAPGVGSRIVGGVSTLIGDGMASGDLDGDGIPDLVTPSFLATTSIFPISRRDVDRPVATVGAWGGGISIGDLTGDGQDDLARAEYDATAIYAGPLFGDVPGSGALATVTELGDDFTLAAGDLTGDAVADLLVLQTAPDPLVAIYRGPFDGERNTPDATFPVDGDELAVGDADGDGLRDVWTDDVCLFVSPLPAAGATAAGCVDNEVARSFNSQPMVAIDANADGYGDLVVYQLPGLGLILGPVVGEKTRADGTWLTVEPGFGTDFTVGAAPDRDGDGFAELLIAEEGAVWAVSAATSGTVESKDGARLYRRTGEEMPAVLGGDFDADGVGDVLLGEPWAHHDTRLAAGVVWVLWGTGASYVPPADPEDPPEPEPADQVSAPAAGCADGCAGVPEGPVGICPLVLVALVARKTRRPERTTPWHRGATKAPRPRTRAV